MIKEETIKKLSEYIDRKKELENQIIKAQKDSLKYNLSNIISHIDTIKSFVQPIRIIDHNKLDGYLSFYIDKKDPKLSFGFLNDTFELFGILSALPNTNALFINIDTLEFQLISMDNWYTSPLYNIDSFASNYFTKSYCASMPRIYQSNSNI